MHVTLIDQNGFTHDVHDIPQPLPRGMRRLGGTDAAHRGVREYHRVGTTTKFREATTYSDLDKARCAHEGCPSPANKAVLFATSFKDGVVFVCADCYPAVVALAKGTAS